MKKSILKNAFVSDMGTQVDILICVIETATIAKNQHRYGLFMDFANAYNTVSHILLFKKLRIMNFMIEDEMDCFEVLYANYIYDTY